MNTLAAILTGLAVAIVVSSVPATDISLADAPTTGVTVATQHAAIQQGLDQAGAQ